MVNTPNRRDQLQHQLEDRLKILTGDVALYVKFPKSAEIFEFNSHQVFPSASIIKIVIACTVYDQINSGKLHRDQRVSVNQANQVDGSGILKLLNSKSQYTIADLVTYMLILSDNSATNQIIDIVGFATVNEWVRGLGLAHTKLSHKMMITSGQGPNTTTARDVAAVLEKLYQQKLSGSKEIVAILKHQQDRRRIPALLPASVDVANKTGSLEEVLHDAGIVYAKHPFVFVFLSDKQKNKKTTNNILSQCAYLCYQYSNF